MTATSFDVLGYFEKLKDLGVPEDVARAQANAFREFTDFQEARNREELATRGDLRETELRLQKEIAQIRADVDTKIANLDAKIAALRYDLLKWQLGVGLALGLIMAKGFGWLGF